MKTSLKFYKFLSLLTALIILFLPLQTAALSANQKQIFDGGIYYFDVVGSSTFGCSVSFEGSEGAKNTWDYLRSQGLTAKQAAGVMGNLRAESGFNPKRVEDGWGFPKEMDTVPPNVGPQGQPGYGIAQWTSPGRKKGLADKAAATGVTASYLGLQLTYLWEELTQNYSDTYKKITQSDSLAEVSDVFGHEYEGYGTNTQTKRRDYGLGILSKYGQEDPDGGVSVVSSCDDSIDLDPNFKMTKLVPPLHSPGGQIEPKGITLHWWGSSSSGEGVNFLVRALKTNTGCDGGCSVQVGITADGKVYQMTNSLTDLTYHAIGANSTTIGIEIEGGPSEFGKEGIDKYPKKFAAVVATVKYLVKKFNIPLDGQVICNNVIGIHPHSAYNSCPRAAHKDDIDNEYFNAVMQQVRGN